MPMSQKRLSVSGSKIIDDQGAEVRLRGVSTFGLHWIEGYSYVNRDCFKTLRDEWGVNVIRLAMYVSFQGEGFVNDGRFNGISYRNLLAGIKACLDLGMYAIVDWHVGDEDQTPLAHQSDALGFFDTVASSYKNSPNILYEICNEPNKRGDDYAGQIWPYANAVIPKIRQHSPDAIVIIGSGQWSKKCVEAWQYDREHGGRSNVLYTLHRYCDGDFSDWSPEITRAHNGGCPILATECGTSNAAEDQYRPEEFAKIINLYETLGISWMEWSLCDKPEKSALLNQSARGKRGKWADQDISEAGHLVKELLLKYSKHR